MYSEDNLYSKDHEWILIQDGVGTIGITDYAQHELGDVVYVDLPEVGDTFEAGDPFGSVESVKAVSEVFCPVSGEVIEVNS
ncbi:MAG: glycine cleavage system protein, partial [Acidobacteria bacterium]|nr:glycine cleavage system protein [Acidobacteriota bacterium]